ncbi:MAG: hypothetical protein QOD26_3179 [Betaproteobacteria bacterium]|nr:hypothetical protein [Betaproteobacteria bacterium]
MSRRHTYRTVLVYALAIAGGEVWLAELLQVSLPTLIDWLGGIDPIPTEIFLKAVDIVLAAKLKGD